MMLQKEKPAFSACSPSTKTEFVTLLCTEIITHSVKREHLNASHLPIQLYNTDKNYNNTKTTLTPSKNGNKNDSLDL